MRAALSLLLALPLAAASDVVTVGTTGGWHSANVTDDITNVLEKALTEGTYDKRVGDTRVCYSEVTAVETQVVAGTNYRFHISGCDVEDSDGECAASTLSSCELANYVVQVFYQSWTSTLKVTKISEDASTTTQQSSSGSDEAQAGLETLSDDEKQAIDAWIAASGLNKFGDEATLMYAGGTPLFDERTGTTEDRYAYIVRRHEDRPWLEEAETATLLAASEPESESQGDGSVAGVLAMLGVFTVVLAGVAVVKLHQGRRERLRYNPIHNREQ